MLLIYNIALQLYFLAVYAAAFFNKKARLWIAGRSDKNYHQFERSAWFHFASLGEFEQGRPVLEAYRRHYPAKMVVITFFSPSGYEIRKDTPLANAVYYLPLDTAANARRFIAAINPDIAIFTKYEYWYHFFNELHTRGIPLYVISGIFRQGQIFFKWYGGLHRAMLKFVSHFFVQDEHSVQLLASIGINNAVVSGDTRFDRVWTSAQQPKALPLVGEFKNNHKLFIAGSTWPDDEKLLAKLVPAYPEWKFIFAPHEISEEKILSLLALLPVNSAVRYSQINEEQFHPSNFIPQILIIDNIGMLSSLYQYGDIAYIGGGFGAGIHNTLEAAAFGLPVIFGPAYHKFNEAADLVSLGCGFSTGNADELKTIVNFLIDDKERRTIALKTKDYVRGHTGATTFIMDHINTSK